MRARAAEHAVAHPYSCLLFRMLGSGTAYGALNCARGMAVSSDQNASVRSMSKNRGIHVQKYRIIAGSLLANKTFPSRFDPSPA